MCKTIINQLQGSFKSIVLIRINEMIIHNYYWKTAVTQGLRAKKVRAASKIHSAPQNLLGFANLVLTGM